MASIARKIILQIRIDADHRITRDGEQPGQQVHSGRP